MWKCLWTGAVGTALIHLATVSVSAPIELEFLPPQVDARDVCVAPRAKAGNDFEVRGTQDELTDEERLRFLRRDIRRYSQDDADRHFDFIAALIARRTAIDEAFTEVDEQFLRLEVLIRAGRFDQIRQERVVETLTSRTDALSNAQRVTLARYYSAGIGVNVDRGKSQTLIRDAAYDGSAEALLEIARLEQDGTLIEGWDAPLDLTITMAFGGMLGQLDRGICRRAERIAREYQLGTTVAPRPDLALAWYKFSANLGGAQAAWRVVEFHLNADEAFKDNLELRFYLRQAVRLGISLDPEQTEALVTSKALSADDLAAILGHNHGQDPRRVLRSVVPYLALDVNIGDALPSKDSPYFQYLREITEMPAAPGRVFRDLATEVLVRFGRWAGEARAMHYLQEAVRRGDGEGQRLLARMLVRYRDDPATVGRVDSLLADAAARFDIPQALDDLDAFYRCQVNDAPRLDFAESFANAYRAAHHDLVPISAPDLTALSDIRDPETVAQIQTHGLGSSPQAIATMAQRVQSNRLAGTAGLRFWAHRLNSSDKALEEFAKKEMELALTPSQRDLAIELFRRVYLNNGVASALDLAIALIKYNGRVPSVASEIVDLLLQASNRGEGAAIRLLARLQSDIRPQAEVYAQFAQTIEERGDFLALMFAMPHIPANKVDDYVDRAVSLMNCGTKDSAEIADAYTLHGDAQSSLHWLKIGLTFEGGHVLSKLRLNNAQLGWYGKGEAPDLVARAKRNWSEGDDTALLRLITLTADPNRASYDPGAAAQYFVEATQRAKLEVLTTMTEVYRATSQTVRDQIDAQVDIASLLQAAAATGDSASALDLGLLLRSRATTPSDLTASYEWVEQAAKSGSIEAMFELGRAFGFGIGVAQNRVEAINWLTHATNLGHSEAKTLLTILTAMQP
ncbi:MAG: hypothetical protein MK098_08820 [Marinovum sp.]|nr:hypothetical protein [Marinovum sp.]